MRWKPDLTLFFDNAADPAFFKIEGREFEGDLNSFAQRWVQVLHRLGYVTDDFFAIRQRNMINVRLGRINDGAGGDYGWIEHGIESGYWGNWGNSEWVNRWGDGLA